MLNKKFYKSMSVFITFIIIIIHGQLIMQEVKNAMIICYNSVIPSLYVFMVFSTYVGNSDMMEILSLPFRFYSRLMKIEDNTYSGYLLVSMIGGFAIGASYIKNLQEKGYPDKCLCAVTPSLINNSLSFCVLAVGVGMLNNLRIGIMLFLSVSCAGLITSFILSFIYQYNIVTLKKSNLYCKNTGFVSAVTSSVQNILHICGFVILFHCLCNVVSLYINNTFLLTLFTVFSEVTCGCLKIVESTGYNPYYICIALSVLPVSTIVQVSYFTKNNKIIKSLILSRLIHTPISCIILSVLIQLFPSAAVVSSTEIIAKAYHNSFELSATLFLLTLCFIIITDSGRLIYKHTESQST